MLGYFAVPALNVKRRLLWTLGLALAWGAAAGYEAFAADAGSASTHEALASAKNAGDDAVKPVAAADDKGAAKKAKSAKAAKTAKADKADKADRENKPADGQTAAASVDDAPIEFSEKIDPIPALGDGHDDFSDIDQRAARYQKEATEESEDARIERELREIKEADAKAEAERAKRDATQRAAAHLKAREQAKSDDAHNRERMQEADKKAKKIQGIPEDELNWRGLED